MRAGGVLPRGRARPAVRCYGPPCTTSGRARLLRGARDWRAGLPVLPRDDRPPPWLPRGGVCSLGLCGSHRLCRVTGRNEDRWHGHDQIPPRPPRACACRAGPRVSHRLGHVSADGKANGRGVRRLPGGGAQGHFLGPPQPPMRPVGLGLLTLLAPSLESGGRDQVRRAPEGAPNIIISSFSLLVNPR